jgi:hypothetical protein
MTKISLDNIGNNELATWIVDHFYYLPEAVSKDAPKGYTKVWCKTLLELKEFLYARGYDVELNVTKRSTD